MSAIEKLLYSSDLLAVLGRDVPVRLLDISGSGCLLQADSRLAGGTSGALHVLFGDLEYVDHVRVVRCQEVKGSGGPWQLGVEFLWTTQPGDRSLRRVIAGLRTCAVKADLRRRTNRV